jgi:hypothetical protein
MTRPTVSLGELRRTAAWEYALRFGFGGLVTVATGLIGEAYGPACAGLFLAFPAILPASLTLMKHHDGRRLATEDARGSRLGAIALAAFAAVVALTAPHGPAPLVLASATAVWVAVAVALWVLTYGGCEEV